MRFCSTTLKKNSPAPGAKKGWSNKNGVVAGKKVTHCTPPRFTPACLKCAPKKGVKMKKRGPQVCIEHVIFGKSYVRKGWTGGQRGKKGVVCSHVAYSGAAVRGGQPVRTRGGGRRVAAAAAAGGGRAAVGFQLAIFERGGWPVDFS